MGEAVSPQELARVLSYVSMATRADVRYLQHTDDLVLVEVLRGPPDGPPAGQVLLIPLAEAVKAAQDYVDLTNHQQCI